MEPLRIGEVARSAGVGVETVRFYERQGLIEEPPRRESGYRQYHDAVIARLRFIRRAKDLGFSLKEIKELLSLRVEPRTSCRDVKRRAEAKIAEIEAKIEDLARIRHSLRRLAAACRGRGPTSECPILDALEAGSKERRMSRGR